MIPNLAVDMKLTDYEWSDEKTPHTVPQTPAPPAKPIFYCRDEHGELVEAGEYFEKKYDKLLATPGWLENLQREQAEKKAAKQRAHEARIAERRERRKVRAHATEKK